MRFIKILPLAIVVLSLMTAGCSKKGAKEIVGKWKMDSVENQGNNPEFNAEIYYTFTKDTLIMEGNIHGQPLPTLRAPYVIKSDDGTNVVIEAEHPQSKQKGLFKIKVEGNKMSLTDPDNRPLSFTKQ